MVKGGQKSVKDDEGQWQTAKEGRNMAKDRERRQKLAKDLSQLMRNLRNLSYCKVFR